MIPNTWLSIHSVISLIRVFIFLFWKAILLFWKNFLLSAMSFKHLLWYISYTTNDVWRVACCFYMIVYNNVAGLLLTGFYFTPRHKILSCYLKRPHAHSKDYKSFTSYRSFLFMFFLDIKKPILYELISLFMFLKSIIFMNSKLS